MKQLILRHHAQPDGSGPTITVVYQQSPAHAGNSAGPFPFALDFPEGDRERLRWYLEEYLLCPLAVYRDRALEAEKVLRELGKKLFHAVFSENEAYRLYARVSGELENTRFLIQANTAGGIALPWEAMRDPSLKYGELAYQAAAFVRGEADLDREPTALKGDVLRVLLAISRPAEEDDVPFQSVARHLLSAFGGSGKRVEIELLRPATFEELSLRLQNKPGHYHVFHFDGHGAYRPAGVPETMVYGDAGGSLLFEDGAKTGQTVGAALAAAKVPIVVLNACQSGMTRAEDNVVSLGNDLLRSGACGVVAMSYSVYVQTAAAFMKRLYERLAGGDDLAGAHKKAAASLHDNPERQSALGTPERLLDWIVPILFETVPVTPLPKIEGLNLGGSEETAGAEEMNVPPLPLHGFHGRDNTILRLERVFQENTVALLWGMAGVGKTTTAAEFARWRGQTGALEGPIFFTSFEHRKTLPDVLREIGTFVQPLLKQDGIEWEHLEPTEKRSVVLKLLTKKACFLIWDNFEPVSGFPSGSASDWSVEEQGELKQFLLDLAQRNPASKVLVTSRRERESLLTDFPAVPLGGLSRSESLELAGAILTKKGLNAAAIRKLPEFSGLIKFLGGNPLAIQVILPCLADGTKPDELLAKLQAGTVTLPSGDATEQGRDKSLVASLTYRLESLSPKDTARLSVVGLFQGFVNAQVLAMISASDDAPAELRGLSTENWVRLLSAATEIGLMRQVEKVYFMVHPALPWFFHENFTVTFSDRLPKLEKLFVNKFGEYTSWIHHQFATNAKFAMDLLTAEESNLLYALRLARAENQDGATSELLYGINCLLTMQGRWKEFEQILKKVESEVQDESGEPVANREYLWASVLAMRVEITRYRRDFITGKLIYLRLKSHYEATSDKKNVATTLHQLGMIAQERRDFAEADRWYRQSLEINQRIGNEYGAASTIHNFGVIAQERRDFAEADRWYRQSLKIKQSIGNEHGAAITLHGLGVIAQERRDFAEANRWYRQSLKIKQCIGDECGAASTLHQLGNVAYQLRDFDEAERWYRQSLEIAQRISDEQCAASTLHQLGVIAEECRQFDEAKRWYRQSLEINQRIGNEHSAASTLHQLGRIAEVHCQFDEAKRWYQQAEEIFERYNDSHNLSIVQGSIARLSEARNTSDSGTTGEE